MEILEARRRSFGVKYVKVTADNIQEVAEWCNGELGDDGNGPYVQVKDKNAISKSQSKAFVGDLVLKMSESGTSFKAFTEKAFEKSFEPIPRTQEVSRSAQTGQFVSHTDAEKHPDVTVTEKVEIPVENLRTDN